MATVTSSHAHLGTPTIQVSDARGLPVRTVRFHRRETDDPIDTRVTAQRYDAVGRLLASRDPYLFGLAQTDASTPFNVQQVLSLSGSALLTDSVDAGWRVALHAEAGQGVETWDGRGSHTQYEHDERLRLIAAREQGADVPLHTLERFTYADAGADSALHNLCGLLVRHDDPAGTLQTHDVGLTGNVLSHTRRFLLTTDAPDWPLPIADREALLEPGDGATTLCAFTASGEALNQTDAMGNVQSFSYTRAGQLKEARLTLAGEGQPAQRLVSDLHYNALGQIERETAGNGVITRHLQDKANSRLTELSAHKADGTPLQQLRYLYDAVGNVLSIEDAAQPIRFFNNQRIEPIKTYRYDTLDQLIEATGSEARTGSGGPALPDLQPLPLDPGQIAHYTQTFHYDGGGNLLDLVHVGAQAQGRTLTRAKYSNHCLPEREGRPPTEAELADGFDANGNLRELQAGQRLNWDLRNQLREVRPVVREDTEDDRECYVYDGNGQRVRKVHSSATNARTIHREVRYLPGLEIRSHGGTGEMLHVISASAGSNSVQLLHWVAERPDEVPQDQMRYSIGDHLKSSTLVLDQAAALISQENYYPYGGTSCWAGRNVIEAKYKSLRYCDKERDATGLLYYGLRYYAPWLARWINPDPAWYVDGINLFLFVGNNPVRYFDAIGKIREDFAPNEYLEYFKEAIVYYAANAMFYNDDEAEQRAEKYFEQLLQTQSLETEDQRSTFQNIIANIGQWIPHPQEINVDEAIPGHAIESYTNLYSALLAAHEFEPIDEIATIAEGAEVPPPSYSEIFPDRPTDSSVDPELPTYEEVFPSSTEDALIDPLPAIAPPADDRQDRRLIRFSRSAIVSRLLSSSYGQSTPSGTATAMIGTVRASRSRRRERIQIPRPRTPSPDY
jgi:insecticidal toxin complex protein TccC